MITKAQGVITDPLYRGTLILLVNTGLLAGLGFVFWTLAARDYPASTVGAFSGLSSGIGIVSAVASLGLPNVITRNLDSNNSPRELLLIATAATIVLGGTLCTIVVFGLGSLLPAPLHLSQHGGSAALFTTLVILTSLNNLYNTGLVKFRATQAVLWTSLIGAVTKLAAIVLLASSKSSGILVSFAIGLVLSTVLSVPPLAAKAKWGSGLFEPLGILRKQLTGTFYNYIATVLGILPSTVVPLEIIADRGAAQAAPFALAFLVSGFLNVIPSTASGVLFAEASRNGASVRQQVEKAIRAIFGLLIPGIAIVVLAAPYIMRTFGSSYESGGTSALRILCLATLVTSGNYLVDSLLLSRDRATAYLFMNGANSALVLGCVGFLLRYGIVGAAEGWAIGQAVSLALGLSVIALGSVPKSVQLDLQGTHLESRPAADTAIEPTHLGKTNVDGTMVPDDIARALRVLESMATNDPLIHGQSPWQTQPIRIFDSSRRVEPPAETRPNGILDASPWLAPPGQIVFLGIWFPLLRFSTGNGQVRITREVPVLVAFSGYSGWLSAELMPSLEEIDILTGCWNALIRIGGKPRYLVWDPDYLRRNYQSLFKHLAARTVAANEMHKTTIQEVYASLERELINRKEVLSPNNFKERLDNWVMQYNARVSNLTHASPADLASRDRKALIPLPPHHSVIDQAKSVIPDSDLWRFLSHSYSVN